MAARPIVVQARDTNGDIVSGALLNVYDAGTTTRRAIYTASDLGTEASNPLTTTSDGFGVVWVDDSAGDIKIVLTNAAGSVTLFSKDDLDPTQGPFLIYPLGGQNQAVNTTDAPTFAGLTLGAVSFSGVTTDPGDDRLAFWDDSAGNVAWLTLGTGVSISGTTLNLGGPLQDITDLTPADGAIIIGDGTDFVTESGATARASLGVGTADNPTDGNNTWTGTNDFTATLHWNGEPVAKTLPTIADLTALDEDDLTDGETVFVKSYGAATGYGGGYLRWDASSTATADNFLVFAPDVSDGTGRWVRIGYAWLSPEMAGALGDSDGTAGNGTDDTAAFRRVGAVLEANKSMALRCEQAGAIYRIYSGVADTADIWNVTDINGFQWDMNGCTLYADRDIRSEATTVFPFQFDGGSNVRVRNGKLRTRARTIDQTADLAGMRWFYFTGTGSGAWVELDCADSVEAVFFQRVSGTDAVTDRWRDIHARIKATRCTYGLALSYSGDDAIIDLDTDGCFRSLIALGVNNPQGVIRSKNHRGGDLKISAYHTSGGDDCPVIGGDLTYIVAPADHSETFDAGINIDLGCVGVDGATIDGLKIRAVIDSNSSKPERQALVFGKYLDDSSTADTTTGRGHVVRNVQISLQARNADASSIGGRLVELFHPTYNGDWTGETIDAFTMHDWVVKGAATNDILLGLNGHTNGPRLVNINADSDLLRAGTHPEPNGIFTASINTANVTASLVLGRISNEAGLTSIRATGGVAGRYGSTTGSPTFVIESAQGGGNFAGGLIFEDSGAAKFGFHAIADGQMRVYANGDNATGTFCANWSAAGHYHPGADGTFDLGLTGTRWRDVYADDVEATNGYSVGGNQVVGPRLTSIVKLVDSSGGTADNTVAPVSGSGADSVINNNFADLTDRINKIIDRLGITAGHGLTSD